jgi:hypothetical protein
MKKWKDEYEEHTKMCEDYQKRKWLEKIEETKITERKKIYRGVC